MTSLERPTPSDSIVGAGQRWARKNAFDPLAKDIRSRMLGIYLGGTLLWQAHRRHMIEEIEAGGGVKQVKEVSWSGTGINCIQLNNGAYIYAHELLKPPVLSLGSWAGVTPAPVEVRYTQEHTLQLGFGGRLLGGKAERDDHEIDFRTTTAISLDKLIQDNDFFPEDIGLTETITTTLDQGNEGERHPTIAHSIYYSLYGEVWGATLDGAGMPDPYLDPIAYRQWALRGNTQIDVSFQAPVGGGGGELPVTKTVIDRYGTMHPDAEVGITSLERYRSLLAFYAMRQYPDLFPAGDTESFSRIASVVHELE